MNQECHEQGKARQPGHGAVVCVEGRTGRMLKLCQFDQGAMVPTRQKAMASLSSVPTPADTASQTELWQEHAATQVSHRLQGVPCSYAKTGWQQ